MLQIFGKQQSNLKTRAALMCLEIQKTPFQICSFLMISWISDPPLTRIPHDAQIKKLEKHQILTITKPSELIRKAIHHPSKEDRRYPATRTRSANRTWKTMRIKTTRIITTTRIRRNIEQKETEHQDHQHHQKNPREQHRGTETIEENTQGGPWRRLYSKKKIKIKTNNHQRQVF